MKIERILAVRNDRFGEFLLNIPALRALKTIYPGACLTLAVAPDVEELARLIDAVDEVMVWENRRRNLSQILKFASAIKKKRFDISLIFNPSRDAHLVSFLAGIPLRAGYAHKWPFLLTHKIADKKYLGFKHEVEYNLDLVRLLGVNLGDKRLSLSVAENCLGDLSKDLGNLENLVAVHPFTSDPIKQWPENNFAELIKRLNQELHLNVVLVGARQELIKAKDFLCTGVINMVGRTSLVQLAALLKKARLLISGDSGPVHLASCVGRRAVVLFRSDMPEKSSRRWGPLSQGSIVIEKKDLLDITVDEVLEKVKLALND